MTTVPSSGNIGRRRKCGHRIIVIICIFLLFLSFLISMNTGYTHLSPADTLRTLFGGGSEKQQLILFEFRLPRIVLSMLSGLGLAVSGCIIQGISRNALADPGVLGINAGAGLMVILYVLLFGADSMLSIFTLPFLAFVGAGLTAIVIYVLAYKRKEGIAPLRLILTGVAIQAGLSSLTTVLVVRLDERQYTFVSTWQAGSIWGSNWNFVLALLPWLLLLFPYVMSTEQLYIFSSAGESTKGTQRTPKGRTESCGDSAAKQTWQ